MKWCWRFLPYFVKRPFKPSSFFVKWLQVLIVVEVCVHCPKSLSWRGKISSGDVGTKSFVLQPDSNLDRNHSISKQRRPNPWLISQNEYQNRFYLHIELLTFWKYHCPHFCHLQVTKFWISFETLNGFDFSFQFVIILLISNLNPLLTRFHHNRPHQHRYSRGRQSTASRCF